MVPRLVGLIIGGSVIFGPQRLWTWVGTGNPFYPLLNNIFKSPYFAPVNANYDFPYYGPHSLSALFSLPWTMFFYPSRFVEAVPAGGYSVLPALFFLALLVGWTRGRAGGRLWVALWAAFALWWLEIRYLRYLLPYTVVAVILLCMPNRAVGDLHKVGSGINKLLGSRTQAGLVGLLSIAAFVPTVASFWNIPSAVPIGVDLGRVSQAQYLRLTISSYSALETFDALARPGSEVIGDAYARTQLKLGLDLTPTWEAESQLALKEPLPKTAEGVYKLLVRNNIDWALVTGNAAAEGGSNEFLAPTVQSNGELVYAADGWDLYRLVSRRRDDHYVCALTPARRGCLLEPSSGASWSTNLQVCPGRTYELGLNSVGRMPIQASFDFPSANWDANDVDVGPGQSGIVYATAPPGATTAALVIQPLGPSSRAAQVSLRANGPPCR